MSNTISTPYMNLTLPIPGQQLGPQWAADINNALGVIDMHTHQAGMGQPVPTGGLNINADLTFNSYNAINLRSARFSSQSATLSLPADIGAIYVVSGNLYYNNLLGQAVQITSGSSLAITSTGTIGGDYAQVGVPATVVYYVSPNHTYYFYQDTNQFAPIAGGPLTISGTATSAFGVTLQASASLSAAYSLTLPLMLPASTQSLLSSDTAGNMSFVAPDNSSLQISSGTLQVAPGGITNTMLAPLNYALSSSSGTFGTSSTSYVAITNLSVTITTSGRPVRIMMVADGSGSNSCVEITNNLGPTAQCNIGFFNGGTQIMQQYFQSGLSGSVSINQPAIPVSSYSHVDFPAAGTYTYTAQAALVGGTAVNVFYAKLLVYEM